ncbi:hypothetical protein GCM10027296_23560 [Chitinimonas naiadis]
MGTGEMQGRIGGEVAISDLDAGMQGNLPSNDGGRQLTADRCGTEDAGIKMKKMHDEGLGEELNVPGMVH